MLGRREAQSPQHSAQSVPHRVPADSFYGRMGSVSQQLFRDEDMQEMYAVNNGRPSIPPSLLSGVLLLQFHDDVSDEEAVQRLQFDLRWQVALDLATDYGGFDPSSLSNFRQRLVEHNKERYAFDRFVAVGRAAGFIADRVTLLTDTTPVKGAGAVQDTYTLLRKGIRKLLKQIGYTGLRKRQGLSVETERLVATYLESDRKASIDWSSPTQRAMQLQTLVQDAEAVLELAQTHSDNADVRATGWLLTKIMGDDLTQDEQGQPQIAQGTAADRIISITDPEMRHGRKSSAVRFNGFKATVSTEPSSELILDIADMQASRGDGQELLPVITRVEKHAGVTVTEVLGDGAYGSGENRAACAAHLPEAVALVAPLAVPNDPAVDKSAFQIDLQAQTATCPQGYTVNAHAGSSSHDQPTLRFTFSRESCSTCPLFERCVKSKTTGRTVGTHPYELFLQAARAQQQTDEFKTRYRQRCPIERKQAELVQHGLRNTRFLGEPKRQLQRLWTGAAVNLKRLFRLAEARQVDLSASFRCFDAPPMHL